MFLLNILLCLQSFLHFAIPAPCNSYPKVLGADTEDTYLNQFDVFGDYLVLAGNTNEQKLTGITSQVPFIDLMSGVTPANHIWGYAFTSKTSQQINGISFSVDGILIIAHS